MDQGPQSFDPYYAVDASLDCAQDASLRFARWRRFDSMQQNGCPICCWLDRRTGRLVYQPDGLDPNLLISSPSPAQGSLE